tara:strand:+ start:1151 stop:1348 length:198 start_codon:yes stop_codon:yes gene_type:complete
MGTNRISDYPLYATSISKPTQELYIFRDNGQQVRVWLTGDQPVGSYKLTPEERIHILENFYKKKS